jgi:hypothetical protein
MGPATAACKKPEVNILPWNWTVSVMKPQEGICFPFAPLRRGPDGLLFEEQGIMLNVAPVSTKNLSFVNLSVRKIKQASTEKCMAVAVASAGHCHRAGKDSAALLFSDQLQGFT